MQQIFKRKKLGFFDGQSFWNFACKYLYYIRIHIKSQKIAADGNPDLEAFWQPWSYLPSRALYSSTKGNLIRAFFLLFLVQNHARARECQSRRTHAAAAGGRVVAAAIFFLLYIYFYKCHRYLHAKSQQDWPSKKPSFFQLKICCIVFDAPCTCISIRLFAVWKKWSQAFYDLFWSFWLSYETLKSFLIYT